MMEIDFTVKPDGGEQYSVKATSRDVVVFEKVSKGRTLVNLLEERAFTDLYRLAHIASKRQGMFTGTLQEFEETVDLDFDLEDDDTDPTR